MERRHTIQKDLVLATVRQLHGHVTADEVYRQIAIEYPSIGKGTVYRNLHILTEEGEIKRIEIPGGPDCFDFTLEEHYHVRCVHCGKVYDVDMDAISGMMDRIRSTQGIRFLDYAILFRGICRDCQ